MFTHTHVHTFLGWYQVPSGYAGPLVPVVGGKQLDSGNHRESLHQGLIARDKGADHWGWMLW